MCFAFWEKICVVLRSSKMDNYLYNTYIGWIVNEWDLFFYNRIKWGYIFSEYVENVWKIDESLALKRFDKSNKKALLLLLKR